MGLTFDVIPSTFAEDLDKSLYTPASYVVENSKIKALEVYNKLVGEGSYGNVFQIR